MKSVWTLPLLGILLGLVGCADLDRIGTKIDMAAEHVGPGGKPIYEGQLKSVESVGAMTSLAFTDGKMMDVNVAPARLVPGDVVRIFQTDKGYEAHLWHSAEGALPSPETNAIAPAVQQGS